MPKPTTTGALRALGSITALVTACVAVTGVTTGGAANAATTRYAAPPPAWAACTGLAEPKTGTLPGDLECAELRVPLDYDEPGGETIGLALVRLKATGPPSQRVGSLLFNPGGPGGSGVSLIAHGGDTSYRTLRTRYDLIGFDPRGVGRSSPVVCRGTGKQGEAQGNAGGDEAGTLYDVSPDTPQEEALYVRVGRERAQQCQTHAGKLLPHVGTVDAVRDMDVMRQALGDERLHFLGLSYGTWLGAHYAHRYPDKVGRVVLDAAVDTSLTPEEYRLGQAKGFQRALTDYTNWVARQYPGAFTGDQYRERVAALIKAADAKPIDSGDPKAPLTGSAIESTIGAALYTRQSWVGLTTAINQAVSGDGSLFRKFATDLGGGDDPDGTQNLAVECADTTKRYTPADVKAALPRFTRESPIFGTQIAWLLTKCDGWGYAGSDESRQVSAPTAAPVLVVGTTGDPATPYEWAPELARQMGSGVLLTSRGEGHSAYGPGNPCASARIDAYLLQGTVPPRGTVCA